MDFKALSIAILEELADPHADKEYISAKLRACIENDASVLYDVMDKKNKALQEKQLENNICIKQLTDETDQLRSNLSDDVDMNRTTLQDKLQCIERLQNEKRSLEEHIHAKDSQLAQAQTTFKQMNEYIQTCQQEIAQLRASMGAS